MYFGASLVRRGFSLRSPEVPIAKGCYEGRLTTAEHNGSNVPRGAMRIGLPPRGTLSDFLEPTKERKRLGHERGVSQANDLLEEVVRTLRGREIKNSGEAAEGTVSRIMRDKGSVSR